VGRAYQALLVATFAVLLCAPGLSMIFWPGSERLYGVHKVAYPPFEASSEWLAKLEPYFNANLGYKRRLVQLHNALGYALLQDLQSEDVLAGRDGWLFLKKTYGWESFRGEVPLPKKTAQGWRRSLRGAKHWLGDRNIPLLYVLVPSKETVYPEFLPASATRARPSTRFDEILPVFDSVGIDYIDLREPLRAAKGGQLYDKLDSHWNGRGAQVGAALILKRVSELLGQPPEFAQLNSELVPQKSFGDLVLMLSLDEYVTEDSVALLPTQKRARRLEPPEDLIDLSYRQSRRMVFEVPDPSLPKALIIRDSFAKMLSFCMAEKFRRSLWIWTHNLDLRAVDAEKPDIVIVELAERFFFDDPPPLMTKGRR
jgi:alginate O-acetyltransferase complex protein AlgJ